MKTRISIALVTGLAIGPLAASPAVAADIDGTTWSLNLGSNFGISQAGSEVDGGAHGAYAGDGYYMLFDAALADPNLTSFVCGSDASQTTEADGDILVECNDPVPMLEGDLEWDATIKLFSGEYQGLVGRTAYELTNVTDGDLTFNLQYHVNTEECQSGVGNVSTSSGDINVDTTDSWLLCNNDNKALEGIVWGNQWLTSWSNSNSDDPIKADLWRLNNSDVTLAAGETVTLVFFLHSIGANDHGGTIGDTDANVIANMVRWFDADDLPSSRLWEGLGEARNWSGAEVTDEPERLADTGGQVDTLVILALGLVAAGLVVAQRRRATRQ